MLCQTRFMVDGSTGEPTAGEGPREVCRACGFDSELYGRADAISSQRVVPAILAAATEGLDESALADRPDQATWSIVEYLDHVREVVFGNRMAIEMALREPGVDLGAPPDLGIAAERKRVDRAATLEALSGEYRLMEGLLSGLTGEQWRTSALLDGRRHSVGWFGRHVLHDGIHHLADIGRIRHGQGLGAASDTGSVLGLNVSEGGVPKRPVQSANVTARGIDGDAQADRRHHGRPVQAICLWSSDVIEVLQAEGHPIRAGAAGENVTVAGVEWSQLMPGTRIDVGTVPMLISAHAIPCAKNAQWFSDRDFNRILHQRHPGMSRLYAIPLAEGTVSVGDTVVVETSRVTVGERYPGGSRQLASAG